MEKRRPKRKFSETFKLSVLREYNSGEKSGYAISKKYSLSCSCLYRWQREYLKKTPLSTKTKEEQEMSTNRSELTETERLQKRIEELTRSLELEKMRSRAFEKMIEITEKEEGITILKKDGAKQ